MAAIDPQPYIDEAVCTYTCIPSGMIWPVVLAALIDVANGNPVPTDTNELMEEARCLESCIPTGMIPYTILSAVVAISGGGGPNPPPPPPSTSWRQIYSHAGDPNGAVFPEFAGPCICLDTTAIGDIWWNVSGTLDPNAWF